MNGNLFEFVGDSAALLMLQFCVGTVEAWSSVRQLNKQFLRLCQQPDSHRSITKVKVRSLHDINFVCNKLTGLTSLRTTIPLLDEHMVGVSRSQASYYPSMSRHYASYVDQPQPNEFEYH